VQYKSRVLPAQRRSASYGIRFSNSHPSRILEEFATDSFKKVETSVAEEIEQEKAEIDAGIGKLRAEFDTTQHKAQKSRTRNRVEDHRVSVARMTLAS
jgi:hypothetical protein